MTIFNAALKAAALLIALAYLIVLANNQNVAGRCALGRWGADDAPPVLLDTQTSRAYAVTTGICGKQSSTEGVTSGRMV